MFERQRTDNRGSKNRQFPKQVKGDAKRFLIINDIANGLSYTELIKKYMEEWGLGFKTVSYYVDDAIKFMKSDETKESIVALNMQRLDTIISDSIKDKDRKSAIRAIDTQNKLAGGYEEKVKLDTDGEINLVFDV